MGTYPDAAVERPIVPAGGDRAPGVGGLLLLGRELHTVDGLGGPEHVGGQGTGWLRRGRLPGPCVGGNGAGDGSGNRC